jgi:hypothetical protein
MADTAGTLHDLLFGVCRSIRYHNRRRRFFDNLQRLKTWLTLVFGSTAMATLLAQTSPAGTQPLLPILFTALTSAIAALDLVVASSTRARLHADLARRFFELERTITLTKDPTEDNIRTWRAERLSIEADEPPILRVLDILCHNELLLAMDYPRSHLCDVPWYKRLLAPFMNLSDEGIETVGARETRSQNQPLPS